MPLFGIEQKGLIVAAGGIECIFYPRAAWPLLVAFSFGYLESHMKALGKLLDSIAKAKLEMLHQKGNSIAMSPAAKAVVVRISFVDDKGGRLFIVKGAKRLKARTRPL